MKQIITLQVNVPVVASLNKNTGSLHPYVTEPPSPVVPGEPGFFPRVLSLCRALSQYLLSVSRLPASLHIPADKEHLITAFTVTATEVSAAGRVGVVARCVPFNLFRAFSRRFYPTRLMTISTFVRRK